MPRVALQASQEFQETEQHNIPVAVFAVLALPQSAGPALVVVVLTFKWFDQATCSDAANAAIKPGEIDYVTRSRIEAAQFPQALQEIEKTQEKLREQPTKEQRVANSLKQLQEYNKVAEIGA